MAHYDPFEHPLLSSAALALEKEALDAQADTAELLLGRGGSMLADTAYTHGSADYDRAVLAVVHQVNFQVEAGVDAEVYTSDGRGARSASYRALRISPKAQLIVDALLGVEALTAAWPSAVGLR